MDCIDLKDPPVRVRISRNARARRFTLRLDSRGDGAVLTVPPGVPDRESQAFVTRHANWLRRALSKQPDLVFVGDGSVLPVAGIQVQVVVRPGRRRPPVLQEDRLILQGAGSEGQRIAAWLKLRARDAVQPAATDYAVQLGRQVKRVALRDTRSRWGSCSTTGTLSFSWRLAMAPPQVLDYVAAHEAAHLVEMNHSPAYWAVVERIFPGWQVQRNWLRQHGRDLHRYRFEAE